MKKLYLLGFPMLLLLVISGVFLHKDISAAESNDLIPERIYHVHKEYIESTYGSGTGFRIVSYGPSGIGCVNHETGEATWDITNTGAKK